MKARSIPLANVDNIFYNTICLIIIFAESYNLTHRFFTQLSFYRLFNEKANYMAEESSPIPVLLSASTTKLTAGSYQFIWGSLDPQQVPLAKVIIATDTTDGDISIILPVTSDEKSKSAGFFITKINDDDEAHSVTVSADTDAGDLLQGDTKSLEMETFGRAIILQNPYGNNWIGGGGG